jgi:hypothetical protein
VVLTQETACRDGATHLVMSLLEIMQRLAAAVILPRHAMSSSWISPQQGSYRAPNHATSRTHWVERRRTMPKKTLGATAQR